MNKPLRVVPATPLRLLLLIGGGEFSFGETRPIDEFFLSQLPEGRRAISFLPTASGSAEYATHLGRYFREIDASVELTNVPVYRGRDARRQKNLATIAGAGAIYLGGGVTNQLIGVLRDSPAEAALREAAAKGSILAAIGAAASCFGTAVRDTSRPAHALPGLGWLEGTVIETGFDPANDEPMRRLMSLPDVRLGLGIPAGTALAVSGDGSTEIVGSGSVAVFRKG